MDWPMQPPLWLMVILVPQVNDAREEGVLVGLDAAVVMLQLQSVATGCSV